MNKKQLFEFFKIEDINDLSESINKILFLEKEERDKIYLELIQLNGYDLSKDWFQSVFETELSERNQKKQDFTPNTVSVILSKLTGFTPANIHEPTAGNGSLLITNWWHRCINSKFPWLHYPSEHIIDCWELSNRSIPILLLNLSIRGIMGYVYHGDVLEKSIKMRYILLNRDDNSLGFSEIIKDPSNNLKINQVS